MSLIKLLYYNVCLNIFQYLEKKLKKNEFHIFFHIKRQRRKTAVKSLNEFQKLNVLNAHKHIYRGKALLFMHKLLLYSWKFSGGEF